MKKSTIWIAAALLLMIGCPWLAVSFAGDAGMAICFILFCAADPLFSIFCGAFAGGSPAKRWPLPIVTAIAFLMGTWLFFDMGEPAFLMYAGCYLILGFAAMLIRKISQQKTDL